MSIYNWVASQFTKKDCLLLLDDIKKEARSSLSVSSL